MFCDESENMLSLRGNLRCRALGPLRKRIVSRMRDPASGSRPCLGTVDPVYQASWRKSVDSSLSGFWGDMGIESRVWGRSLEEANLKRSGDTMPRDRQAPCRSWSEVRLPDGETRRKLKRKWFRVSVVSGFASVVVGKCRGLLLRPLTPAQTSPAINRPDCNWVPLPIGC